MTVFDAFPLLSTFTRTIENVHRCKRKRVHLKTLSRVKKFEYGTLSITADSQNRAFEEVTPFTLYAHAQMMVVVFPVPLRSIFLGDFSADVENAAKTTNKTVLKTRLFHSIVS